MTIGEFCLQGRKAEVKKNIAHIVWIAPYLLFALSASHADAAQSPKGDHSQQLQLVHLKERISSREPKVEAAENEISHERYLPERESRVDEEDGNLPLVSLIGRGCPVRVLLLRGHGIPFLGLLTVPPSIIKVRSGILNNLVVVIAVQSQRFLTLEEDTHMRKTMYLHTSTRK